MENKLDNLIRQIQEGKPSNLPLVLAYTEPEDPMTPGTVIDNTPIIIYSN